MTNDILGFAMYISFLLIALMAAGIIFAVVSFVIMYGFANSKAARWLEVLWFDEQETPEEIWNHKAGECISGKKWRER